MPYKYSQMLIGRGYQVRDTTEDEAQMEAGSGGVCVSVHAM